MRIVSLFSGAGGLDLGLICAGHRVIWANDNYQDAVETYRLNIGDHVRFGDIARIDSRDIPSADVVVGGFPCQGFSVANWDRKVEDDRNVLYRQMVRVIREKRPRFFVAENVKGIVSLGGGSVLEKIVGDFSRTGYDVQWRVLNCADYGVPQLRMRFIMLGVRHGFKYDSSLFPPKPTHANPKIAAKVGLAPWVSVGSALSRFPDPDGRHDVKNHDYSKYKLTFNGHIGHRRIDPDSPAPTVTARGDSRGGVVVLHHPGNRRRMSVRELAAVQSFPDDFVFSGPRSSAYRQVANAVPPLLGMAIGEMLMNFEKRVRANSVFA